MFYCIGFVLFDCFLLPVLLCVSFYFIFVYVCKRFEMLLLNALYKIKFIIIIIIIIIKLKYSCKQ